MTFPRRLFAYCGISVLVWFVAQVSFLFCFFTYELGGKYFAIPLYYIAYWTNFLVQPFYPQQPPEWAESLAWPISCAVSLIGWLLLACVVATIMQVVSSSRHPASKA